MSVASGLDGAGDVFLAPQGGAGDRCGAVPDGQPSSSVVSVAFLVMVTVWVWPSSESTVMV